MGPAGHINQSLKTLNRRSRVVNQIHGFLLAYGVVVQRGRQHLQAHSQNCELLRGPSLPGKRASCYLNSRTNWNRSMPGFCGATHALMRFASRIRSVVCERLEEVPGVGRLISTAVVGTLGDGREFRRGGKWRVIWAWCLTNTRLMAKRHCEASANAATFTCGSC